MSENSVCHHCGSTGPTDARFCPHCGRALGAPGTGWRSILDRVINNLSPLQIALLGLALSVLTAVFADRMIETTLSVPISLVPLALVIGLCYAYMGWHSQTSQPGRNLLLLVLAVFLCMGAFLLVIWLMDAVLLGILSDNSEMVVYQIPGVHIESAPGMRIVSIAPNAPPYWLLVMTYGILAAFVGNLIHRSRSAR